ncbi:MAG: hypothetical protein KC613_10870, partial [Myxococcales bacterium]|nr:hypothetical protein [Myxococcales bacterium]
MSQPLRVLVVGSDEPGRRALIEALAQAGVHGEPVATLDALEARAALGAGAEPGADGPFDPDAILAAHGLGALDGFAALNWVQQRHPDWPVLLYDRSPTVETTIRAIHGGAHDLLRWPGPADPLVAAVRRAARQRHSSR